VVADLKAASAASRVPNATRAWLGVLIRLSPALFDLLRLVGEFLSCSTACRPAT
jgi:hypothetical protein